MPTHTSFADRLAYYTIAVLAGLVSGPAAAFALAALVAHASEWFGLPTGEALLFTILVIATPPLTFVSVGSCIYLVMRHLAPQVAADDAS